ncbi:EboA domain-containing protein [Streptomyces sp. WMMC940]|uniref:EboA domain-containing protein n=1 Tax=Streptomyces sp. WMMC940 TaxID=3015153 RepID=UPI0022B64438|nr:EboA domain-containing protein [Streptomyces sp. WMMC940]MCZ7456967.1 EboA domain-containing protein [Streptomyces sp. WMMC940]
MAIVILEDLVTRLDDAARSWLHAALAEAARSAAAPQDPTTARTVNAWETRFASAGRHCGSAHADSVRTHLLHAARPGAATLTRLYRQGTAAERRAVLLALHHLAPGPADGIPLVEDALRTNDTRLVAAAVGPYATRHLPPHSWRHALLKCLFTGVPVDTVDGLVHRSRGDTELARMLTDYAAERAAANRPVPADLHRVLALTSPTEES